MVKLLDILSKEKLAMKILTQAGILGRQEGVEVYVVGGVVRDLILGIPLKEIDLMVVGDGIKFASSLAEQMGIKKIVPFPKFKTAKIPNKSMEIEIASARKETYGSHSRKPSEVELTDLNGDLIRRDFTVNAMAMSILPESFGMLYDPYSGIKDMKKRILKTPLNPDETFSDDPLRMMRAAYFASKLGFEIEADCYQSMIKQAHRIKIVSRERITAELFKILKTNKPSLGLIILQKTGLLEYVFPEINVMVGLLQPKEWHHKDIFSHTMEVVDNTAKLSPKLEIRFAALVHDIGKPRTRRIDTKKGFTFHGHDDLGSHMFYKIARRMKLSNELREYTRKMILLHLRPIALAKTGVTDSAVRRVMVAAGPILDDLMILCRADITTKNPHLVRRYMGNFERVEKLMIDVVERDAMKAFQSPVRGDEIMEIFGIPPGELVGKIKSDIEDAILEGKIENTYESAFEYMMDIKNKNKYI